jgi:hypothetical protein
MSFEDEHNQLRSRFATVMAIVSATTPIDWPNVKLDPKPKDKVWVRFNIQDAGTIQTTFGATTNNHRSLGIVVIQVFEPEDKGDAGALAMADTVAAIFRNWGGSTVRCREASKKVVGLDGHGWYQINVNIPFQRNELL